MTRREVDNLLPKWSGACLLALVCAVAPGPAWAEPRPVPRERAAPPEWTSDAFEAFFPDARQQLAGQRPQPNTARPADASVRSAADPSEETQQWSDWIDETTLTTEVKRIHNGLRMPLANPSRFKAGGYLQCQHDYSLLALLMMVIGEHPDRVRWHDQAPLLARRFAAAADAGENPSDEGYAEASAAQTDLEEIIRGGRLSGDANSEKLSWEQMAERRFLMQRMETALETVIQPAVANAATLEHEAEEVQHQARLVTALAQIAGQPAYEFADDPDFVAQTVDLRNAAAALARAAEAGDHQATVRAVSQMTKSCSNCHEGYR